MNFGSAIEAMNNGFMVSRTGWNGKGMFVYKTLQKKGEDVVFHPSVTMYTAQGDMQPGWLASQADMLAEDWGIVEP